MKLILVFLIICFATYAHAFNWNKCSRIAISGNGAGTIISTSSYISSTRECSMFGMAEDQKKMFIVQNLEELQIDLVRGQGEYLEAYATLSGCDQNSKKAFSALLQKNYARIYEENSLNEPKTVYEAIEQLILLNPKINDRCKIKS